MKKVSHIFFFLFLVEIANLHAQTSSDSIYLNAVLNSDLPRLEKLIAIEKNPNKLIGKQQLPIIYYALVTGKVEIAGFLKKCGAEIDYTFNNKNLLSIAIQENNLTNIELFTNHGANVNLPDSAGYSPLMQAVKYRHAGAVSILLKLGADLHYCTSDSFNALDVAATYGYSEIFNFLKTNGVKKTIKKTVDFTDGPHLKLTHTGELFGYQLCSFAAKDPKIELLTEEQLANYAPYFPNINTSNYTEYLTSIPTESNYTKVPKIIAIGDVHGCFEQVSNLLHNNGVIDSQYNWTWGAGHLVFIGDIFDRGDQVTQMFWLIVKLTRQANQAGGKVHLIVGNHEVMVLNGDYRYLHKNYYNLCNNLNISYAGLFKDSTFSGNFIRKSKLAVIINDNLFVHAGISPEIANKFESVEDMNKLSASIFTKNDSIEAEALLHSALGPLWYRGYYNEKGKLPNISDANIEQILQKYAVKALIAGHTEVETIKWQRNRKFIGINKSFVKKNEAEALYIEKGKYFRALADGTKVKL